MGDTAKSCVWASGGVPGRGDFVVVSESVLEGDASRGIG